MAQTVAVVGVILANFIRTVNMGGNMNAEQISQCAADIVAEKYYLSLDDIDLCFRMVRTGKLKLAKDPFRMDQLVIFEYLEAYDNERQKEKRKLDKARMDDNNIYDIMQSGPLNKILHEVTDRLKFKPEPQGEFVPKELPPFEDMVLQEFDKLHEQQQMYFGPIRVVGYNGYTYQFTEYRQKRYEEITNQQTENQ